MIRKPLKREESNGRPLLSLLVGSQQITNNKESEEKASMIAYVIKEHDIKNPFNRGEFPGTHYTKAIPLSDIPTAEILF